MVAGAGFDTDPLYSLEWEEVDLTKEVDLEQYGIKIRHRHENELPKALV